MARCATASWRRSARRSAALASLLAARLAELEGRDIDAHRTSDRQRANSTSSRTLSSPRTNPLRKPDGSVMTLILLAGSTASAVDSYFLDSFPDRRDRREASATNSRSSGPAAADDAGPDGRLPGSPAQWHRVHRALRAQRRLADARVGPLPRDATREFLGGPRRVRPQRGGRRHQEGRGDLRRRRTALRRASR